MKKLLLTALCCASLLFTAGACRTKTDLFGYVSELRDEIYFYQDDTVTLKIYRSDKETPYSLDGVKGKTSGLCEVYFESLKTANEVEIELLGREGEMNYLAVSRSFYLSFASDKTGLPAVPVKLTVDGAESRFDVPNVGGAGVISPKDALNCAVEYDKDSFDALKNGNAFSGEISVRLLFDGECYYYVGLCDRQGNVHAYLLDAGDGRVIAERQSEA